MITFSYFLSGTLKLPCVLQTSVTDHFAITFSWDNCWPQRDSNLGPSKDKELPVAAKISHHTDYKKLAEVVSVFSWQDIIDCGDPE